MKTTKYGNFSADGKEFIVTDPMTQRPWMNVLSNGRWCFLASHLGGGYSFLDNPTVGRITRWHIDGVPRETVGKFLYLRDDETGNWWTANGYPPVKKLDKWRCRVGLGYNTIEAEQDGIASELTFFTPMPNVEAGPSAKGDPCELWLVKITNTTKKTRTISTTSYAEIALGNWYEDTSWREFYTLFNRQVFQDGVMYNRSTTWVKYLGGWQASDSDANNLSFDFAACMASSAPVVGYEGDRYKFVGLYRDLANPEVMDRKDLGKHIDEGRDACLALQHRFTLAPGESAEFVIMLGAVGRDDSDAKPLTSKYCTVAQAKAEFENLKAYWARVVNAPIIKTPDSDLDMMVNYWFKYQGANLSWWNRNTGYCYFGIYNFGVRDACQDAVSRLSQDPAWVREHLVKRIFVWQFPEGDWAHGGNFLSGQGTRTKHSDDPLNPLFIIGHYVRETGDYSILDEVTPYAHSNGKQTDTIYKHLLKSMEYFWTQFSERGLPLIVKADWNDALNMMGSKGKGESVMNAGWVIICLDLFWSCMEKKGDLALIADWKARCEKLKKTVNELCWDGDWYWRGTHDSGWVLGSKSNTEGGMIFGNPNAFAIVAGIADQEKTQKILKSFDKYLDTEYGSYCFYPPFPKPDPRTGTISRFAPGTKENGSLQGHNSRWRAWAEFFAGRGDEGYNIIKKMLPPTMHEKLPETYGIEPYAACQFIYAPESGNHGEGSHSWATGTACWTLLNVWEHMFGVTPQVEGLKIDPCLPKAWTEVSMDRPYRGSQYQIVIKKKAGICKGKISMTLDGKALPGNVIPPQAAGKTYKVVVNVG